MWQFKGALRVRLYFHNSISRLVLQETHSGLKLPAPLRLTCAGNCFVSSQLIISRRISFTLILLFPDRCGTKEPVCRFYRGDQSGASICSRNMQSSGSAEPAYSWVMLSQSRRIAAGWDEVCSTFADANKAHHFVKS
jgi:hypothetical protein